jgi:hypothetical protein
MPHEKQSLNHIKPSLNHIKQENPMTSSPFRVDFFFAAARHGTFALSQDSVALLKTLGYLSSADVFWDGWGIVPTSEMGKWWEKCDSYGIIP